MSKIDFIEDGNIVYAVSQKTLYKGKMYDELMWAEIEQGKDTVFVRWEDDFMKRHPFLNIDLAKAFITNNTVFHSPHINGASYNLDTD